MNTDAVFGIILVVIAINWFLIEFVAAATSKRRNPPNSPDHPNYPNYPNQ